MSPLRLRLGMGLILLWWLPFWALAPALARSLAGTDFAPSAAAVTTTIVILQTVIGLIGFLVVGSEMAALLKGQPKKRALGEAWYAVIHGRSRESSPESQPPPPGEV